MSGEYLHFKFRAIDKRLIESLINPSLFFAKPATLNDPFDCRLDLRNSLERAAASASGERATMFRAALKENALLEDWVRQFEGIGVCSFSLDQNEVLLWSHYADNHKGVSLLFRFTEQFLLADENKIIGASPVNYGHDLLTEWLKTTDINPNNTDHFVEELTKIFLTAKSPAWAYEKEARILRLEHGPLSIPKGTLEQVCFGLQTPQTDIDLIIKLASEYSGCKKFGQVLRDIESDFGITIKEL